MNIDRLTFAKQQAEKPWDDLLRNSFPEWVSIGYGTLIFSTVIFAGQGFGYEWDGRQYFPINHTGRVNVGHNVIIHDNVTICRGTADDDLTSIGEGTRIDGLVYIAHNVKIGRNCLIHGGVIIAGSAKIGDGCVIEMNAVINKKINICDNVRIMPLSHVRRDITEPGLYGGNPIKKIL